MKTPDEIKRGLEVCGQAGGCLNCPYTNDKSSPFGCGDVLNAEALAYIRQLEREKQALIEVAPKHCLYCKHYPDDTAGSPCDDCTQRNPQWVWRGVEEEER